MVREVASTSSLCPGGRRLKSIKRLFAWYPLQFVKSMPSSLRHPTPWLRAFWQRAYTENVTGLSAMVAYNLMLAAMKRRTTTSIAKEKRFCSTQPRHSTW